MISFIQLPCNEQYVLGKRLYTILTMINSLTDTMFSYNLGRCFICSNF